MINKTIFNRAPLASNELAALPLGAIRPQQWLKEQLERAASGLTGRLDDFWPSVKDSAWRGGKGDGAFQHAARVKLKRRSVGVAYVAEHAHDLAALRPPGQPDER